MPSTYSPPPFVLCAVGCWEPPLLVSTRVTAESFVCCRIPVRAVWILRHWVSEANRPIAWTHNITCKFRSRVSIHAISWWHCVRFAKFSDIQRHTWHSKVNITSVAQWQRGRATLWDSCRCWKDVLLCTCCVRLFLVVLCFIPLFSDLKVKKFPHTSLVWGPDFVFVNQNLRYTLCDKLQYCIQ